MHSQFGRQGLDWMCLSLTLKRLDRKLFFPLFYNVLNIYFQILSCSILVQFARVSRSFWAPVLHLLSFNLYIHSYLGRPNFQLKSKWKKNSAHSKIGNYKKIHKFCPILMKLGENDYLLKQSFSPSFMRIGQKLRIFC